MVWGPTFYLVFVLPRSLQSLHPLTASQSFLAFHDFDLFKEGCLAILEHLSLCVGFSGIFWLDWDYTFWERCCVPYQRWSTDVNKKNWTCDFVCGWFHLTHKAETRIRETNPPIGPAPSLRGYDKLPLTTFEPKKLWGRAGVTWSREDEVIESANTLRKDSWSSASCYPQHGLPSLPFLPD